MTILRKLIQAEINSVGDDEVEVIISTSALARDGHILVPEGCVSDNYRRNPIWLWSHDTDVPTGNAENITITTDSISCRVRFAPRGISPRADEVNGLVKAGVIRAASIGFDPIEMEPLDPKKPRGGQRITKWDWLEASWVSVPSDVKALVTARAHGEDDMSDALADAADGTTAAPAATPVVRAVPNAGRAGKITFSRGLYQVASLCYMFEELGWQLDMAKYEAAAEEDSSKVPGMLAAVLADLGDALLAMTAEEVAEALAGRDIEPEEDPDDIVLVIEDRAHIRAAATPAVRAFRRGLAHAKLRAGKTLSADTARCLREAKALHEDAMDLHRSAMRKHKDGVAAVNDMLDRAGASAEEADETQSTETAAADASETDGKRMNAQFRRRQAEALGLAAVE